MTSPRVMGEGNERPMNAHCPSNMLTTIALLDAYGAPFEMPDWKCSESSWWSSGYDPAVITGMMRIASEPLPAEAIGSKRWTDDTALNLALARSILENQGRYNAEKAAKQYRLAIADPEIGGWGRVVRAALERGEGVKGTRRNGALMRAPAMLYAHRGATSELWKWVEQDVRMTHDSDVCVAASVAYLSTVLWMSSDSRLWSRQSLVEFVRINLTPLAVSGDAKREAEEAISEGYALAQMHRRRAIETVRMHPWLASGDVISTLITATWLGIYERVSGMDPNGIVSMIHLGIAIGGDTDTRLALAAPFANNPEVLHPGVLWRLEEITALERKFDEQKIEGQ